MSIEKQRREAQGRARGRRRDVVGDLLSRRRPRRARVLRLRHPRSRRGPRPSRRSATCSGIAGCRRAPSSATCSRSWPRRGRCPEPIIRLMRSLPPVDGMDALRTLTSALAHYDPEADDASPQAQYRKAVRLTAQIGTHRRHLGPAAGRRRADRAGSGDGPRRQLPLHADRASGPSAAAMRAFDVALTLHADHELNASTFAGARRRGDAHRHLLGGRRRRSAR